MFNIFTLLQFLVKKSADESAQWVTGTVPDALKTFNFCWCSINPFQNHQ